MARGPRRPLRSVGVVPPTAGGAVMATGLLSVALETDGYPGVSTGLDVLGVVLWAILAASVLAGVLADRSRLASLATRPGAFTAVAGTAVLATRFALGSAHVLALGGLVLAIGLAAFVAPPTLGHWRRPTVGASFLVAVAAHSVAILCAVARAPGAVAWTGLGFALAGLVAYGWVARDFDLRQLLSGAGDQWVAGGALAIATLALAQLAGVPELAALHGVLATAALVVYLGALAWLPALVATEVLRPRLGFDLRRWATVFPIAMYAQAGFALARAGGLAWPAAFARRWLWVAVVAWVAVAAASVRHAMMRV